MTRRRLVCVLLLLALSVGLLGLGAAAEDDPLISLSYLESVYKPQLVQEYQLLAGTALSTVYAEKLLSLCDEVGLARREALQKNTALRNVDGSFRVKSGDVLTLRPGTSLTVTAGSVSAQGSLSDVTQGVSASGALTQNHRYLAAADTAVTVTSETAVVLLTGSHTLAISDDVDYNSLADALYAMGLFRGGSGGYELERTPTRAEGLVMFLRLLGLEDAALASTAAQPFSDVPSWADRYVAYAYAEGLTQGTGSGRFSPDAALTGQQYLTFLLRALHYAEGSDFTYDSVLTDCVSLGVFRASETALVSAGFTRARMVYLSFYSLFGVDQSSGQVLLTQLEDAGTLTAQSAANGLVCVVGARLQ